ncbi:YaaA family protein [Boudabousia marimammalium]|uniref:Peroxide stress protein YaaA n=1 Tax=Boudabousia marimammalium TaxID=156892 RepID=A0A1Q5PNR7_9ACTO|nr:peroxide stress protein YaaA [Boudabousia marimammalium]OKL49203.1 hypothetical protein BM477_04205 [Boudabousia marimammalium]
MLILLPPSEGKNFDSVEGDRLDLDELSFPQLKPVRELLLDELIDLSESGFAREIIGVGPKKAAEVAFHAQLRSAPTRPAAEVYSGVLYEAARWADWPLNDAAETVYVTSALWGLVSPIDMILPYRLSMGVSLPEAGAVKQLWKQALTPVLDERAANEIVLDFRSGAYQAVWPPTLSTARRAGTSFVTVRVVTRKNGVEKVVSHHAKHARGELAGYLISTNTMVTSVAEAFRAAQDLAAAGTSTVIEARLEGAEGVHQLTLVTA